MASTPKLKAVPSEAAQKQEAQFESLDIYLAEVKRFLLEKDLRPGWVDELIAGDRNYVERAFEGKKLPVYAAFEVYITEEESAREPVAADCRLKLEVTDQAKTYLQQLVKIGLWGDSVECVAATLIQQQLASKLEAGLFPVSVKR